MIWRVLHCVAAVQWGWFLAVLLIEIFAEGNLQRNAVEAGHYDTSLVLWMIVILAASLASAIRGLWLEPQS
jgi:hypothetical protein